MTPFSPRIGSPKAAALLLAGILSIATPSFAVAPVKLSGAITGQVRDGVGIPQMGATVLLFTHEDRLFARALTDANGGFSFLSLMPEVYSIRVSLRSFAPVFRNHIQVQPGMRSVLNVNLTTLFSTIQLVTPPEGERALMNDDWKWVLRSASSTRPILRVLPNLDPDGAPRPRHSSAVFSETRGLVELSGGDGGQVSAFGNEADLGTAFAFATSLFGANQVAVSGNLGYTTQSGMASAGFRTSYGRDLGRVSPVVSLTMRETFLPRFAEAFTGGPAVGDLPPLRTMSINIGDEEHISDALRVQYGFSLDSVSFLDRLHYFSPYVRLDYTLPDSSKLDVAWTSGNARPDLGAPSAASDSELQRDLRALSILPRLSLLDGRAKVQRGEDLEIGYSRKVGSRTYRVSGYRERVSNAALTISGPASGLFASGDLLPDMFSDSSIFNAGEFQTLGYTVSATQSLGDNFSVTVMYGSIGVLAPRSDELTTDNPEELRSLMQASRRNAVTTRGTGTIAKTGTHFIASYQWMDQRAVTPGPIYTTQPIRPEPGLNIYVRQPIPTFFSLPWRMEATADLRNLLAQGYLPLSLAGGQQLLLVQTPRSVRGGVNFIF